ncbi:GntR family transcriptional regulator [Vagococcus sp. BWB3-3]|uniref:GntR family transcriptional regulator n=1 Tax=Vagococcus allomyrinae TaxID=2794353 RepID=A0A940P7E1_9ENTE|nr:GntR family transcriptional regulator [Vagococcus allomyrinae]MBP1041086.1 GntR family transcriptional regulator [Vagococcus allomyrinae]
MQKYIVISNDIRNRILKGEYQANQQIPFEKDLCVTYDSSKMTIKKALDILVTEGLIIKRRGSGTFVKDINPREMERLSVANQFRGTTALNPNRTVLSKIINFSIIPCPEVAQSKLNLTSDSFVYDIYRVRHIDGLPTVMEKMYMPIDLIPGLKAPTIEHSIYEYIEEELHLVIQSGHRNISARKVTDFEAEHLHLEKGDPVAVAEQIGYLDTGAAFEYSISVHRYDDFSIDVVLTRD